MLSRYDAVMECLSAGVVIHDATSAIIDANQRARDLLGIQVLEGRLATDPAWVFLEADHSSMPLARFPVMQVIASGEPVHDLSMIVQPPTGPELWTEVNALPVVNDVGQLEQVVVTFIDTSARQSAQDHADHTARYARSLIEASLDPLVTIRADGRITDVNAATEAITGMPRDTLVGSDFAGYFTDPEHARAGYEEAFARGSVTDYPLAIRRADGTIAEVLYNATVYQDETGEVAGVLAAARDVTELKRGERRLAESEELLRLVLDTAQDVTLQVGRDGRIQFANKRVVDLTGVPRERWIGRSFAEMGYPADLVAQWDVQRQRVFDTGEPVTYEFEMDNASGHRWYETTVAPGIDLEGRVVHVIETSRDFTERKTASDALQVLATHDPLTGLANRAALVDDLTRSLRAGDRSGRTTAVLMMDLDRFKVVNDTLGHGVGDELLVAVADRLRHITRAGDLVARLGGDEFVVELRDLEDGDEADEAALRVVEAFREPFTVGTTELYSTVSIGVARSGGAGSAGDLLREADTAMYAAKDSGRDRVAVFNEDLRAAATTHMAIETDLRHALERKQLAVWYQPEIDLSTGAVVAVEALLRWHHPDGSVWTADRFIDVAEETGLIVDIGDWVLWQVCADVVGCARSRGYRPLIVRVNASAVQLAEAGFLAALDAALAASGLDPATLCMEITETALLRQTTVARDNLAGIHQRGIAVAIDDFGAGYASLTYLNRYPVDIIKIDRSFIAGITVEDSDRRLVAGIIALARMFGVTVTAEGVERPEQATVLREMGCPSAQGYLYSKAVPCHELAALLERGFPCH